MKVLVIGSGVRVRVYQRFTVPREMRVSANRLSVLPLVQLM